ncbi:MAG: DMT family transporter [Polyangiaceae bacterium]
MSDHVAVMVVFSALLHAIWNAIVKRDQQPRAAGLAVLGVATVLAVAFAVFSSQVAFPETRAIMWAVGAGAFEGGYFAALGLALARGPLGPAYTVARGGAMLVTWPISVAFLGESFPWAARAGAFLIALGLALTALNPRERATAAGLGWAALGAVCIGGYHVCYKLALEARAEPAVLFALALACALPINAVFLGSRAWRESLAALRRKPLTIAAGGASCTASFLVFLKALSLSGAGAVLTLRNTSVLFAQVLAVWAGERVSGRALSGALLVVGGAVLLAH